MSQPGRAATRRTKPRLEALDFVIDLERRLAAQGVTELQFVAYEPRRPANKRIPRNAAVEQIIAEWLAHFVPGPPKAKPIRCGRGFEDRLRRLIQRARQRRMAVSLCSKCRLADGKSAHIPMMDLKCAVTPRNRNLLIAGLRRIGQRGVLFVSGASYHYYGIKLMAERDWLHFQAQCLLLGYLVDHRYIGHRILQGMGTLRITAGSPHKPVTPFSVAQV